MLQLRAGIVLVALFLGSLMSVGVAKADTCELPVSSDIVYEVDQGSEMVSVTLHVAPDASGVVPTCTDPYLWFPVIPGIPANAVSVAGGTAPYNVSVHAPVESGKSAVAEVTFSVEDPSEIDGDFTLTYSFSSDGIYWRKTFQQRISKRSCYKTVPWSWHTCKRK